MFKEIQKAVSMAVLAAFSVNSVICPAYAQFSQDQALRLPAPGTMVRLSPEFVPAQLQGIIIHPDNALQFDFLINKGDRELEGGQKADEYRKLVKYFLASLTIPDEDQWVNLSPYEKHRIIKDDFGKTEMGRDLLAEDYLLKQITSSLIYPEDGLGKKFWDKVYERAWKEYHTTDIPVNTFNKVWIVPDQAYVYESGNAAYILKSHLKVMLEEDYLSLKKHAGIMPGQASNAHIIGSQVIREIILPELEHEVNEGKNFAALRQMFSGMILATWYKRALKESLLGKVYADKDRTRGVDQDPKNNEAIYQRYLKAFKKGVFNYIKEDVDKYTHEVMPKKYFSGGFSRFDPAMTGNDGDITVIHQGDPFPAGFDLNAAFVNGSLDKATVVFNAQEGADKAMVVNEREEVQRALSALQGTARAVRIKFDELGVDSDFADLNRRLSGHPGGADNEALDKLEKIRGKLKSILPLVIEAENSNKTAFRLDSGELIEYSGRHSPEEIPLLYDLTDKFKKVLQYLTYIDDVRGYPQEIVSLVHDFQVAFKAYNRMLEDIIFPEGIDRALDRQGYEKRSLPQYTYDFLVPATDQAMTAEKPLAIVAEDDNSTRHMLEMVLTRQGFHVLSAVDPFELQELMAEYGAEASILVTDTTGWIESVKESLLDVKNRTGKVIPVVATSGANGRQDWEDANVPISAFLTKPYELKVLINTVRDALPKDSAMTAGRPAIVVASNDTNLPRLISSDLGSNGDRVIFAANPLALEHAIAQKASLLIFDTRAGWISPKIVTGTVPVLALSLGLGDLAPWKKDNTSILYMPFSSKEIVGKVHALLNKDAAMNAISSQHKKYAIIIYADKSTDWNGALSDLLERKDELEAHGYTVRNTRVDSVDSLIERVDAYSKEDVPDLLIIGAHGTQGSMRLGNGPDGYLTAQNVGKLKKISGRLAQGGTIILNSCSTGRGEDLAENMANAFSRIFPQAGHVFAPRVPAGSRFTFDAKEQVSGIKYDNHEEGGVVTSINVRTHETNLTERGYDAAAEKETKGGIDFNAANLDLEIKRDGNGVPLPMVQQDMSQLSQIQGFEPEIIHIQPAVDLPVLNELRQKLQLQSV